ncbi:hypothetical protein KSF_015800 [Reticulibacter mediterranei]|jgi:hypothetical protein|uniref:Uncharacterized protein n=1 Tax=Reticulibacter mediterranei TaxID=2778369 RepID=A0A8J3N1Q4_9CHLR|nr:hypothetical protein KSF_015800 [Reticulibacter mediterranei]
MFPGLIPVPVHPIPMASPPPACGHNQCVTCCMGLACVNHHCNGG